MILSSGKRLLRYLKFKRKSNKIVNTTYLSLGSNISNSSLDKDVFVSAYTVISNSRIGELSSIGTNSKINHTEIGKFCAISWNVTLNAISHPIENLSISAFPYVPNIGGFVTNKNQKYKKVIIGNDVWIGANVVVMPGIKIGDGAVIGAGSVVTKDIPKYTIAVGVPARVIRNRFNDELVDVLEEIKWWDLPRNVIKDNIHLFQTKLESISIDELKKLSLKN